PDAFAAGTFPGPERPALAAYQALRPEYIPDELLLKFKIGVSEAAQAQSLGRVATGSRRLTRSGWVQVRLAPDLSVTQALAVLAGDRNVAQAQPNHIYEVTAAPNDSRYRTTWAMEHRGQAPFEDSHSPRAATAGAGMNLPRAWGRITDCSRTLVAVLDTGINYTHVDLAPNMWEGGAAYPQHGFDFIDGDADPMDLNGHGTHVAGIIGAVGNDRTGVIGVCWKARIMAVRVANALGLATTAHLLQGIDFALAQRAEILYIGVGAVGPLDRALSEAIAAAEAADAVVATGAGNGDRDRIGDDDDASGNAFYPCNYRHRNLICVAALDRNDRLASFSNWGATSVDVGAPGTDVSSTWAGRRGRITDAFNDKRARRKTTSGRWGNSTLVLASGARSDYRPGLVNPANFPHGKYANNADERTYRTFDLRGKDAAILSFYTQFALQPGDYFNIAWSGRGGDPFANGVLLDGISGGSTDGAIVGPLAFDISPCIGPACSIGFQLLTDASGTDQGVAIIGFTIDTLELNRSSYHTTNGTSLAAAHVAGLAAMLRAYEPRLTAAEVITAIKQGRKTPALAGKIASGAAVDAHGALSYVAGAPERAGVGRCTRREAGC
ncbi:MAG TPA: S8 family serine peptidase, partial [Burkholderiales bacterium]